MDSKATAREPEPWRKLGHKVERVGASIQCLASQESIGELRETIALSRRMDAHPYGMLAAALGAGYVLGGGLFSSVTRSLLSAGLAIGLRAALIPLLGGLTGLMPEPDEPGARHHTGSKRRDEA